MERKNRQVNVAGGCEKGFWFKNWFVSKTIKWLDANIWNWKNERHGEKNDEL